MLQWSDGSTAAYSSGQMTQSREVDTERLFDAAESDGSTAAYSSGQMTPQSREVDTERLFDAAVVRWKHCSIQ